MSKEQLLPIVINDDILSKIYNYYQGRKQNHTGIAYGMYMFLYKTARIQNNIRVYATESFLRRGLGIGIKTIRSVKAELKEMGLIEEIHKRINGGVFEKRYFEVKFVWKPETLEKLFYQESSLTTEYKIARELLVNNFDPYEEIESGSGFDFDAVVNGQDAILSANTFYFDEDQVLIAVTGFNGYEGDFNYTVTTDRAGEVIRELAGSYKFSFVAILKTLQGKT